NAAREGVETVAAIVGTPGGGSCVTSMFPAGVRVSPGLSAATGRALSPASPFGDGSFLLAGTEPPAGTSIGMVGLFSTTPRWWELEARVFKLKSGLELF